VYVDKPDVLNGIVDLIPYDDSVMRSGMSMNTKDRNTTARMQKRIMKEKMVADNQHAEEQARQANALARRQRAKKQDDKFRKNTAIVEDTMKELDDIDKELRLYDETKRSKIRRQFEDWNTNVHGAIMTNIHKQIDAINPKDLAKTKCDDYGKFLDITNRKPAIYRDIIIESEYDPLEPNRRCITAKTKKFRDPIKTDIQKYEEEASMLPGGNKSRDLKFRETLNVESWATGKVEATPHGVFAKMMSEKARSGPKSETLTKSNVFFNDFKYPTGRAVVDAEMPRGKRTEQGETRRSLPFLVK
jgi:hypothetical protein